VRRASGGRGAGVMSARLAARSQPPADLDGMLKRLHLPTVRRLYTELALRAEEEEMSYRNYLEILMSEEVAHRAQTRITRSVRKAKFPFLRTVEAFDCVFRAKSATESGASRPPVPAESGHRFRSMPATRSGHSGLPFRRNPATPLVSDCDAG